MSGQNRKTKEELIIEGYQLVKPGDLMVKREGNSEYRYVASGVEGVFILDEVRQIPSDEVRRSG